MPDNHNSHLEIRNFNLAEIRALSDGDTPRIVGTAAVYNSRSVDLGGFVEIIEPGFFRDVLDQDTRAYFNHNRDVILGRRAAGTLELRDTPQGLGFEAQYPDTQLVRDMVITPMQRGDINQCSFAFRVKSKSYGDDIDGDEWTKEGGIHVRILKAGGCRELADVSVVSEPAYPQTSAEARSKFSQIQHEPEPGPEGGDGNGGDDEPDPQVRSASRKRQLELIQFQIDMGGDPAPER